MTKEVVRRSELVCEVIDKLVGNVEAVGETNTDGRHLNNLKVLENVLRHIIVTIGEETPNAKRYEWSMKESGEYAIAILRNTKAYIEDTLGD
ncbi:hypothetical protein [Longicatena caecimuris]|uniref:hypothetical protein n=1 Tax=Longicatena caecimuris TaxID=1796635 RepID=UPI0018AA9AB9|nr:hypothetical protein [Longicatena caecimuris]